MSLATELTPGNSSKIIAGRAPDKLTPGNVPELIEAIYDGPDEAQPWLSALKLIRSQLRATWVALMLRPATAWREALIVTVGGPLSLASESPLESGKDIPPSGAFRELPLSDRMVAVESAGVLGGSLHVIGADVVSEGFRARLRIARTSREGMFTEAEVGFCQKLLPHFRRVMRGCDDKFSTQQEVQLLGSVIDSMCLGIVVLGDSGDVLKTNRCANELLHANKGLKLFGGKLRCDKVSDERKLLAVIRKARDQRFETLSGAQSAVVAIRPEGGSWLSILVKPIAPFYLASGPKAPSVALFIRSPDQDRDVPHTVIQALFGLTPTEAALALEIANGLTMDEAAEVLDIMRNTARTHLRSIFAKVGVRRQTSLMRVILNSVATMV